MLTLPLVFAVASAGALGGLHCVGMCGGLSQMLGRDMVLAKATPSKQKVIPILALAASQQAAPSLSSPARTAAFERIFFLHAGRLSLYAGLGAVVGGVGASSLWLSPFAAAHQVMFVLGNLALILLALRLASSAWPALGGLLQHSWQAIAPTTKLSKRLGQPLQKLRQFSRQVLARGQQHPFLLGLAWGCLPCGLLLSVLPFALLSASSWAGAVLMLVFGLCSLLHLLFASLASRATRRWQIAAAIVLCALGLYGLAHLNTPMQGLLCVTGIAA